MKVSDKILATVDLDAQLAKGPQSNDVKDWDPFYDKILGLIYDKIYRSAPPRTSKDGQLHSNNQSTLDLDQVKMGNRPIAWIPSTTNISTIGQEIPNDRIGERAFTSKELTDAGFKVIDIYRGDFNLVTAFNRWIVYIKPEDKWRALALGAYITKSRDQFQADPSLVDLSEYYAVVGILLGYSDADILLFLEMNGLKWAKGMCYDAYRCNVRSRIAALQPLEKSSLNLEFSQWLAEYEMIAPTSPSMTFFEFLELVQYGRSEIAAAYLKEQDVTIDDFKFMTEFPVDVDPAIFAYQVGGTGTHYSLEQALQYLDRIVKDVTAVGHECYLDSVVEGKRTADIADAEADDFALARLKRRKANNSVCIGVSAIYPKDSVEMLRRADKLNREAEQLERGHAYDYNRVCPFDNLPTPSSVAQVITPVHAESEDLQDIVLAGASFITRVKNAVGAELTPKQQAELSELQREKYLLKREKKKTNEDLNATIARVQRNIINLQSDIAKYNRIINSTQDRKLRGLANQDAKGSVRQESHDETIEKVNALRTAAENDLRSQQQELEALQRQKTGKAKMVTASCPKIAMVGDVGGSEEEANRLFVALTSHVNYEPFVYKLYLKRYHQILKKDLHDNHSLPANYQRQLLNDDQAKKDVRLVMKLKQSMYDPQDYLGRLSVNERSETLSALRHIDDAYEEIKRMSER